MARAVLLAELPMDDAPLPAPHPAEGQLSAVIDSHLRWMTAWHRAAFFWRDAGLRTADDLPMPTAFLAWVRGVKQGGLSAQPAVDRLVTQHEQMHRMARLVLMRAAEGDPPSRIAYEAVVEKFDEFMVQLRRVEKAFSMAGSGLDPLTGLRNRTGLMEELGRELNRFRRGGEPFCLAMCDLDRFKAVNDTYGHEAGDRVLVATAGAIQRGIRSFDEAFRLGGEEILIVLKETRVIEGLRVLERLRADIAAQPVPLADGRTVQVTASFGLAEARLEQDVDALIEAADQAVYRAKREGRSRVVRA